MGALHAADQQPPQPGAPIIQPGPTAATPPQFEAPPETIVPEIDPTIQDPGYREYGYAPGRQYYGYGLPPVWPDNSYDNFAYGAPGFNFGYGYRPLGYTFWPRYGDYTDFGRYFVDPYRYYTRPYMWNPYWSYQRYRQYPVW